MKKNSSDRKFFKKSALFYEIFTEWTQKVHLSVVYLVNVKKNNVLSQSMEVHNE